MTRSAVTRPQAEKSNVACYDLIISDSDRPLVRKDNVTRTLRDCPIKILSLCLETMIHLLGKRDEMCVLDANWPRKEPFLVGDGMLNIENVGKLVIFIVI